MSKTKIIRCALTGLLLLSFGTFVNAQETPETQSAQETQEIQNTPETQSAQASEEIQGTTEKQDTKEIKEIKETNRALIKNGIKEYTTVRGDTLWSIAKKELNDPFMWPAVWKENPDIDNPRWIYPGQIIKIPLYLVQEIEKEEALLKPVAQTQEPSEEEVIEEIPETKEHPLVNENLIIASGYIAEAAPAVGAVCGCPPEQIFSAETPRVGQVDDSSYGHTLFGDQDVIYVKVDRPVKVGDKFYIVKVSDPISHPITVAKIGHVITISGIAEIVEIKSGDTMARITKCFGEIFQGDILDNYYDIKVPMTTGSFRSPDINGMVLAAASPSIIQSTLDIVYIDKGCKDGIEIGDMFRTMAVGHHVVPNGIIQVISCKDHTATAIVQQNSSPIMPGNIFTKIENKEATTAIK